MADAGKELGAAAKDVSVAVKHLGKASSMCQAFVWLHTALSANGAVGKGVCEC
jgi:hypothetical protein